MERLYEPTLVWVERVTVTTQRTARCMKNVHSRSLSAHTLKYF